ncbi:TPA: P2 family phage major capsid protein [Escherichia coli]|nr:P2 family phage major capsid protein [Escherichia coli]
MNLVMSDITRNKLGCYMAQQASLNNIPVSALVSRFTVEPSVQQRFENASKESTEFTKRINVIGVTDQKGEKILPDTTGPIARTNTSYDGTKRRNLFNSLRLPVLNSISGQNPNAELLAGQLILSSRTIGGLGVFLAPFFPDATMLITSFNNLSIYWQKGSMRRLMKDEPEYNRIATYQSINDAYVVEDYGKCAMVTGLKFADS